MAHTLRLTQHATEGDHFRVEVALEGEGLPRQTATSRFEFALQPHDEEHLRWYLEDYLQQAYDPAPTIAAGIEGRMAEIGSALFRAVFGAEDARDLWATVRSSLADTRVEIVTGVREATRIPWELLRDPRTDAPVSLASRAFVRAHPQAAQRPRLTGGDGGPVRILLVICRPGGGEDVPFRSVASRLIKGLEESAREVFQLDVLRPPTFEQLARVLRAAKAAGTPYHVVHFDGHGVYVETTKPDRLRSLLRGLSPLLLSGARSGAHGHLMFENPDLEDNVELVDGPTLGRLLVETGAPVLVLNACRSAHAEPPPEPAAGEEESPHAQVRALGSLAQEVMDAGVAGVVAMRYNVYVVTAAQFVADLYGTLIQGHSLGEAVTLGRKQLASSPLREVSDPPRPLQDWCVPVVYEAAPISLFPRPSREELVISLAEGQAAPARDRVASELPSRPDAGFFGRDETLLALDRAFDTQAVVLLHGYAGSGKTAAAAEFARWYALTGGIDGPVLFTSFEHYTPLARVLDPIGQVFGGALESLGIHWLALSDAERRSVALQVLRQVPVLWMWDNVEPVAGFPAGSDSPWSREERQELADFLRAARDTRARFLLTSRRDERGWLAELPARVKIPPMPLQESWQLARALAEKQGRRASEVEDWRPLLAFARGNPLTLTVLVGQALRDGRHTRAEIEAFVTDLKAGEAAIDDEIAEGRERSLAASLGYGFGHAFDDGERRRLALLHLFRGFVDVDVLVAMGNEELGAVGALRDLTREEAIALLDRAAEVGLLSGHGGGYYSIHPALPWYFRGLFEEHFAAAAKEVNRAFVSAMAGLASFYSDRYDDGQRAAVQPLMAEEANLLRCWGLARSNGWWPGVIGTMHGLHTLYDHKGRQAEWERLVAEVVEDFVDRETEGPLAGREEGWRQVTSWRAAIARSARRWEEAERWAGVLVEQARKEAEPHLSRSAADLDPQGKTALSAYSVALGNLAGVQLDRRDSACFENLEAAYDLKLRIGDRVRAAVNAFHLGHAYTDLGRDLDKAEHWYRRSLELREPQDVIGRASALHELGQVTYARFQDGAARGAPREDLLRYLNQAARFGHQALELLPEDNLSRLAVVHHLLGNVYDDGNVLDRALTHYQASLRCEERQGDRFSAARLRREIARALAKRGRFEEALEYGRAALRDLAPYGEGARDYVRMTEELIATIEQMRAGG